LDPIYQLDFHLKGYGTKKGIPTVLLAASGLNSVFAIIGYGVVFGLVFSARPIWQVVVLGFAEVFVMGIAVGYLIGKWLMCVWTSRSTIQRFGMVFGMGLIVIVGSKKCEMGGGGALGVLCLGMTLTDGLGTPGKSTDGQRRELTSVKLLMDMAWSQLGQPMLFGLLGSVMTISSLDGETVGGGIAVILIGLLARGVTMSLCLLPTDWNFFERAFAAVTWCPKATVQAALSTVALDYVEDNLSLWTGQEQVDQLRRARQLFVVAVLSIILTAPLFAVIMSYTGRMWLQRENVTQVGSDTGELSEVIEQHDGNGDPQKGPGRMADMRAQSSRKFVMRIDMDYEDPGDWLEQPLANPLRRSSLRDSRNLLAECAEPGDVVANRASINATVI
jgi:hypothetical protein